MRDLIDDLLQAKVKAALFGGAAHDRAPRLGRLIVLERLGEGAMGQVVAAYDPRLDRKVAVKLLRATDAGARGRLLAEARALAKVSDPSVVPIYDVEELEATGTVYVVMELLVGPTLRAWGQHERSWREVIRIVRQVASGLATVHDAGLLHRDVKPDNIILGGDRGRLIDFGLATLAAGGDDGAGTPAYLAPEVLRGTPASPASDQFALAVTAWELLNGEPPYDTHTRSQTRREALATAAEGAARARPRRRLPGFVHRALVRALSAAPAQRFASLRELASALDDRPRRRRRAIALGLATTACAAAVTWSLSHGGGDGAAPCQGAEPRFAGRWSAELAVAVDRSLGDSARATLARRRLASLAREWPESHQHVCEATRVRGEQSEALLDLRIRCLDRQLDRLVALGHALVAPTDDGAALAREAAGAISELPTPAACEALTAPAELAQPADEGTRRAVAAVTPTLDVAWAQYVLGRYQQARAELARLAVQPDAQRAETHAAFAAQRLLLSAGLEARIGSSAAARALIDELLVAAARAEAPVLEAEAWVRLLRGELFVGDPARVIEWAPFARPALVRAQLRGAAIDSLVGQAEHAGGNLDAARTYLERSLAAAAELRFDQRAIVEMRLGWLWLAAGRADRARTVLELALATARSALGDDHPELALFTDKLAIVAREQGDLAGALAEHARTLAIRERAFGPVDRSIATALVGQAETLLEAGRLDDASAALARAAVIRTQVFGAGHRRSGDVAALHAELASERGDLVAARTALADAMALDPGLARPLLAVRVGLDPRGAASPPEASSSVAPGAALLAELVSVEAFAAAGARVELAVRRGDRGAAHTEARAMLAAWTRAGGAALTARTSNLVGEALAVAGDRDDAAAVFAAARGAAGLQPSRAALRAARGLAAAARGDAARAASAEVARLRAALPALAEGQLTGRQ